MIDTLIEAWTAFTVSLSFAVRLTNYYYCRPKYFSRRGPFSSVKQTTLFAKVHDLWHVMLRPTAMFF